MPGGSVYTVSVIGYVTGGLALVVQYTLPLDYHPPTSIYYSPPLTGGIYLY